MVDAIFNWTLSCFSASSRGGNSESVLARVKVNQFYTKIYWYPDMLSRIRGTHIHIYSNIHVCVVRCSIEMWSFEQRYGGGQGRTNKYKVLAKTKSTIVSDNVNIHLNVLYLPFNLTSMPLLQGGHKKSPRKSETHQLTYMEMIKENFAKNVIFGFLTVSGFRSVRCFFCLFRI